MSKQQKAFNVYKLCSRGSRILGWIWISLAFHSKDVKYSWAAYFEAWFVCLEEFQSGLRLREFLFLQTVWDLLSFDNYIPPRPSRESSDGSFCEALNSFSWLATENIVSRPEIFGLCTGNNFIPIHLDLLLEGLDRDTLKCGAEMSTLE